MKVEPETTGKQKVPGPEYRPTGATTLSSQRDFTKVVEAFGAVGEVKRFVAWTPGAADPETGKFSKVPVAANGEKLGAWQKPENHLSLQGAIDRAAGLKRVGAGIGVAFTGEAIAESEDGDDLYLVALDLDTCVTLTRDESGDIVEVELTPYAKGIVKRVGSYAELSPSGKGIRILAYSTQPMRSGKAGKTVIDGVEIGREVFASSGFVTLTGWRITKAGIRTRTEVLAEVAAEWNVRTKTERDRPAQDEKVALSEADRLRELMKLEAAVEFLNTESYEDFVAVMKAFACVAPGIGYEDAIRLAERAANNAPEDCQVKNDQDGTNPEAMVLRPGTGSVDDGIGRIMKRARIGAVTIVAAEIGKPRLTERAARAFKFLEYRFPNVADALAFVAMEALP